MGDIEHTEDERARCQHCPNLADERSFMCEDCAAQADEEVQTLRDQLRGAVSDRDALAEAARGVVFAFLAGSLTRADMAPLVHELDRLRPPCATERGDG